MDYTPRTVQIMWQATLYKHFLHTFEFFIVGCFMDTYYFGYQIYEKKKNEKDK